jgi:hypothetical protein
MDKICFALTLAIETNDQSLLRNILKVLEYHNIPENHEGLVYDICIKLFTDLKADIAPRAFAITLALKVVIKYPELRTEFLEMLNIIKPDKSAAIQFRIKKAISILQSLN